MKKIFVAFVAVIAFFLYVAPTLVSTYLANTNRILQCEKIPLTDKDIGKISLKIKKI